MNFSLRTAEGFLMHTGAEGACSKQ